MLPPPPLKLQVFTYVEYAAYKLKEEGVMESVAVVVVVVIPTSLLVNENLSQKRS